ncbi:hypothetical protein MLD38_005483 [Melastoma candidum]|uniref:Uncharacterized protein n=1 Tax=Melastoma candidum TaxID=119954 RepID=A0ACB9RL02_9MYRT|nr:hypothetical protein MLD38_005483 [Melastoma candidum]
MEGGSDAGKKKVVMVAIDDSDCSHHALLWALENLRPAVTNSRFLVFSVQSLDGFGYVYAASVGQAPPELIQGLEDNRRKLALALLEKAKGICSDHGVDAELLTAVGDPKEQICKAVKDHGVQLLVLGSHSRGPISRAFLGSVSNYCVHNAKCPVLVVKKPPA